MVRNICVRAIALYIGAVLLCVSILIYVMRLWNADLSIPFSYSGDALDYGMLIKASIDNGWFLNNEFVGLPGVL